MIQKILAPGHAKVAFLNDYFAHDVLLGSLILHFHHTHPKREKQEFKDSIVSDAAVGYPSAAYNIH
jgi:glutamyl-tRNA synthetase